MSNLTIQRITVEHMQNPIGLDVNNPRFCWILRNDTESNVLQEAYQLKLFSDAELIADTGKIVSEDSIEVQLSNLKLTPKTRYAIDLTVWDNKGNIATSESYFETGFMDTEFSSDWYEPKQLPTEKSWDENSFKGFDLEIESEDNRDFSEFRPCQYIRIPMILKKEIKTARVYISCHGVYRIYVNGKRVDDREFAPDITSYQGLLQYQTYDIADFLNTGENVIGIILADGWWVGRVGLTGDTCQFGQTLGLIIESDIVYIDGTKEKYSGADGRSSTGPLIFSDIFVGEKYDATKELKDWCNTCYDDSAWEPLIKVDYPKTNLVGQYGEAVRPIEIFKPAAILTSPLGETIIDAGQVLAGQIEFTIDTTAGHVIKLEHFI